MSNQNETRASGSSGEAVAESGDPSLQGELQKAQAELADRVDKAWQELHRKAERHILGVCAEAAQAVTHKGPRALQTVSQHAAYLAVLNAARFAIEPVIAKIAGCETWAQLEADMAAQERALDGYAARELRDP